MQARWLHERVQAQVGNLQEGRCASVDRTGRRIRPHSHQQQLPCRTPHARISITYLREGSHKFGWSDSISTKDTEEDTALRMADTEEDAVSSGAGGSTASQAEIEHCTSVDHAQAGPRIEIFSRQGHWRGLIAGSTASEPESSSCILASSCGVFTWTGRGLE